MTSQFELNCGLCECGEIDHLVVDPSIDDLVETAVVLDGSIPYLAVAIVAEFT